MNRPIILAIGLFAASAFPSLYAQTTDLHASIPFDFRVDDTLMPAGDYSIHLSNTLLQVLEIGGGKHSVFAITNRTSQFSPTKDARLQFRRYGNAYFLAEIWDQGSQDGRTLLQSRHEKELAKGAGLVEKASVPLKTGAGIALKTK